ncbi:MAG: 16S rRNA (cytosine(1402)-N(4))-methyltransferase RsmH [Pseudomonadota bacterium]
MAEHAPVLVEEAVAALAIEPAVEGRLYVDATFGRGGHAARILGALGPRDRLLAIDRDPAAIAAARARFDADPRLVVVRAAFGALEALVAAYGEGRACRGVLFDLGVSSPQLDEAARGFSFQHDGPLDMRMDPEGGESAAAWLARADGDEIRDVIGGLGEERFAGRIARAIVEQRQLEPITTTGGLAAIVGRAVRTREAGKNPATRTFQAIRMHVNDELGELERGLDAALAVLAPGGRLAAISFHSLEDRMVKHFMRTQAQPDPAWARLPIAPPFAPALRLVGKKQRAGAAELAVNPRARSAILRVAERLDAPAVGARA